MHLHIFSLGKRSRKSSCTNSWSENAISKSDGFWFRLHSSRFGQNKLCACAKEDSVTGVIEEETKGQIFTRHFNICWLDDMFQRTVLEIYI